MKGKGQAYSTTLPVVIKVSVHRQNSNTVPTNSGTGGGRE